MRRALTIGAAVVVFAAILVPASASDSDPTAPMNGGAFRIQAAVERLAEDNDGRLRVVHNPATGLPRLLDLSAASLKLTGTTTTDRAMQFFELYGAALGINEPARELEVVTSSTDALGMKHISFYQVYEGIPVYAAILRLHFDPNESLASVNGTVVPNIHVDPVPYLDDTSAAEMASRFVGKRNGIETPELVANKPTLYVYQTGLARGVSGVARIVWEVEITHPLPLRELVYVDAHNGAIVDHIQGLESIRRVIHQYERPNPIWEEGDRVPFSGLETQRRNDEINNLIEITAATYSLFANLSHGTFLSYDGRDSRMHSIYERKDHFCPSPNAAWDGESTSFCFGMVVDDVVAHEWLHAYTNFTHGLVYAWQPGALNESYSDIFGELIDLLYDGPYDEPGPLRADGACSTLGSDNSPTNLRVQSPASAGGSYLAGEGLSNPQPPWSVHGLVELADDGTGTTNDACESLVEFTPGNIALLDHGGCAEWEKMVSVRDAGAAAAIFVNDTDDSAGWVGGGVQNPIPAISVGRSDGDVLKAALDEGLTVTISQDEASDESLRWLLGEGTVPLGANRDLWNPRCFSDPGSVRLGYACSRTRDFGGVHSNSGVPNHAFALLVDGGTYNRQTITAIGPTKAAHIYWRAMSTYQVPVSGFAEHADYLELSCSDLVGAMLTDLVTGEESIEIIDSSDCDSVAAAMLAVNMRTPPVQCDFQVLLESDSPPIWVDQVVYSETFDANPGQSWERSNQGVNDGYQSRDWKWWNQLPGNGLGGAFFAIDSPTLGDCNVQGDDQSGVMHLSSPGITLPAYSNGIVLVFDHYVATEAELDGGNLKLSVNGGPFRLVEAAAFKFNPYNNTIRDWNTSNPLAGEPGFTGKDEGQVLGTWGQSQVDLGGLAAPGDMIRIRFDFGTNRCRGDDGWYVDNLKILSTADPVRSAGRRIRP